MDDFTGSIYATGLAAGLGFSAGFVAAVFCDVYGIWEMGLPFWYDGAGKLEYWFGICRECGPTPKTTIPGLGAAGRTGFCAVVVE